ncbi:MAG TPA: dTDP-4-dehydrorhamnose reductase [Baekduia sp.]|uniref:dTDP-4-dehydrorhamnose reductase n=1 Tax=Baekduia sp. TaxID=2600305 RepID=UPI002C9A37EF|nr:dTDP-4-dehydrorhamnose reductase [Baekduia sp.]HMJ36645.1 dTDP-4-dehydrorhamnose reductase [Baekduia sp.]
MRLLVTGAAGMLGHRVVADARARGWAVAGVDLPDADLTDPLAAQDVVEEHAPDAVVHCAAFTDVDGAEEQEARARAVNADASANIAAAAAMLGARIVAVSTDYVFDGTLTGRPYVESDPTGPVGAYGRTKLAGEDAVAGHNPNHAIARTAWLFGVGGKSFPDTMLTAAQTRDEVAVVTDQIGSPTWAGHLSPALLDLAAGTATGVFHIAGGGQCSWHELTVELYRAAGVATRVNETTAAEFARPAPRPAWSVLATERDETPRLPPWQDGVAAYLQERNAS